MLVWGLMRSDMEPRSGSKLKLSKLNNVSWGTEAMSRVMPYLIIYFFFEIRCLEIIGFMPHDLTWDNGVHATRPDSSCLSWDMFPLFQYFSFDGSKSQNTGLKYQDLNIGKFYFCLNVCLCRDNGSLISRQDNYVSRHIQRVSRLIHRSARNDHFFLVFRYMIMSFWEKNANSPTEHI